MEGGGKWLKAGREEGKEGAREEPNLTGNLVTFPRRS